jgi:hypothetical protein
MSTRTLSRRFVEQVGATPARGLPKHVCDVPSNSLRPQSYRWRRSQRIQGLNQHRFCASISPALSGQLRSRIGVISQWLDLTESGSRGTGGLSTTLV